MSKERDNEFNFSVEDILNEDYQSDEVFSLESILAEFKGEAFIDGDKKTPPEELSKKAEAIVREILPNNDKREENFDGAENVEVVRKYEQKGKLQAERSPTSKAINIILDKKGSQQGSPSPNETEFVKSVDDTVEGSVSLEESIPLKEDIKNSPDEKIISDEETKAESEVDKFFDSFAFSDPTVTEKFEKEISRNIGEADDFEEDDEDLDASSGLLNKFFAKNIDRYQEEEEEPEPKLSEMESKFSAPLRMLNYRVMASGLICVLMVIVTFAFEKGVSLPIVGTSSVMATGVVLISQLLVMLIGVDILINGVEDITRAEIGIETLVLVSCFATVLDGAIILIRGNYVNGLPFSVISATSIFFTLVGRKSKLTALVNTCSIAKMSANPYGVLTENESMEDRSILKKVVGETEGFYRNMAEADVGENVYGRAAPLLIIASLIFALLTSVGRGRGYDFPHCLGIIASVTASFPAASVFALPFKYASVKVKRAGAAIAGWGGACDISEADGALLTDEDIFPVGTVSLSGVKFYENISQGKVIIYTSSLVIASKSGLIKVFKELLRSQGLRQIDIKDFSFYEGGGIGALIEGERVLVGSGGFMNLMGIRIPENINMQNAVFTAINDRLVAVFSLNYAPANSVQSAFSVMMNTSSNLLLAVRDFNITPNLIQKKFKISTEGIEFISVEKIYKVSDTSVKKKDRVLAILCREGLAPFAEIITRGKLLKMAADVNTLISVAGSVLGLLLMFFLCWTAAFTSASAGNAFSFMIAVEICVLLLSQILRRQI